MKIRSITAESYREDDVTNSSRLVGFNGDNKRAEL